MKVSRISRILWRTAVPAALTTAALGACSSREAAGGEPSAVIADTPAFFIGADSASIADEGAVTADGTMLCVWRGRTLAADTLPSPLPGRFTYRSRQPLVDALYALEAATPAGTYSAATPWRTYLVPLPADTAAALLDSHRSGNVLQPAETRRYFWPVVNDDPLWLLAAAETAAASGAPGEYRRLRQLARTLAERDAPLCWNPLNGLFQGLPSYLAATGSGLPAWMEPTDIFECISLAGNVARTAAANTLDALDAYHGFSHADYLPVPPDSLRRNINTRMWLPARGVYSGLLYGSPAYPVQLASSDNAAVALAILGGVASDAMTATAVRRAPVTDTGTDACTPAWTDTLPATAPSPLLRQALWTAACARSGNEAAYSAAVSALLYHRLLPLASGAPITRGSADRAITALILRGLLGMSFKPDGIGFAPFVPENLPGEKTIEGLRYRQAILTIRLSGTGNAISTFTIDGTPSEPFLPADLEGEHTVTITLAGASAIRGEVNLSESAPAAMPLPPAIAWSRNRSAATSTAELADDTGDGSYRIYINGILTEETDRHSYTLHDTQATATILITAANANNTDGFSATPYTCVPAGQRITVPAASVAKPGTRIISDKAEAERLVELNRYRNRNVNFEVEVPLAGTYLLDVRYLNGLGIVNRQRRTVLRRLEVNSRPAGILVFPQLSAAWWDKDLGERWQQLKARTNAVAVELHRGVNTISLRYHQPSPVYLDPNHNTVLIETINITYLHPQKH